MKLFTKINANLCSIFILSALCIFKVYKSNENLNYYWQKFLDELLKTSKLNCSKI